MRLNIWSMHVMTSKWQGRKVQERAINKFSFLSHENGQIQREITKEKALKRISTLPSGFHLTFNWTRHFASHAYFTIKGRRHLKYYPKIHPCYGNSINITWQLEEALDPLLMLYLWHQCFRSELLHEIINAFWPRRATPLFARTTTNNVLIIPK